MPVSAIFNGLTDAEINSIIYDEQNETLRFKKGEVIFNEENFAKKLGIVSKGKAKVFSKGSDGVVIRFLTQGMCFGVATLFNEFTTYVSTIKAAEDCEIIFIPQYVISKALTAYPKLAENYICFLTGRIHYLNALVDAYSSPNVETRLARYMLAYAEGKDVPFDLNMTELSKSLAIGRASLYRALDSFEQAGYISKEGKQIKILNYKALKQI